MYSKKPDQVRENVLRTMGSLYAKTDDAAGALFCIHRLGITDVNQLIQNALSEHPSFEWLFSFVIRLRCLGEYELADIAFNFWKDQGFKQ